MDRALPFTIRIPTRQATTRLCCSVGAIVMTIDFAEVLDARFSIFLTRIATRYFEKL